MDRFTNERLSTTIGTIGLPRLARTLLIIRAQRLLVEQWFNTSQSVGSIPDSIERLTIDLVITELA